MAADDFSGPLPAPPKELSEEEEPVQGWEMLLGFFGYRDTLLYNRAAYLIIAVGFGTAFLLGIIGGDERKTTLRMIGGFVVLLIDWGVRFRSGLQKLLLPDAGGRFFFLPIWIWGLVWIGIGVAVR